MPASTRATTPNEIASTLSAWPPTGKEGLDWRRVHAARETPALMQPAPAGTALNAMLNNEASEIRWRIGVTSCEETIERYALRWRSEI
jgi:hypothetical protein